MILHLIETGGGGGGGLVVVSANLVGIDLDIVAMKETSHLDELSHVYVNVDKKLHWDKLYGIIGFIKMH